MSKKKIDRVIDELFAVINNNYSTAAGDHDAINALTVVLVDFTERVYGSEAATKFANQYWTSDHSRRLLLDRRKAAAAKAGK